MVETDTSVGQLRIGLQIHLGTDPREGTIAEQIQRTVPLLEEAEAAGLASIWVGEAFHRRPASFHLPASLLVLAHLAALTKLDLGTGVLLARAQNAERLAVEGALLDQMSEGRVTLGIGLGPATLRGELGGPDSPGAVVMDQALSTLRDAWSGAVEDHYVPSPYTPGGPPVLVGGGGSAAVQRAATLADGYYAATNYSDRLAERQCRAYLAARDAAPVSDRGCRVAVNRLALLHPDHDTARRLAEEYLGGVREFYRANGIWNIGGVDGDADPFLVGTPSEILEQLAHYRDWGFTDVNLRVAPAGVPAEVARATVEQLGEHVLPFVNVG